MKKDQDIEKYSWYEKFCNFSEKIIPIKPWNSLNKKYSAAINFSHLRVTPRGSFSATILAALLIMFLPVIATLLLGIFESSVFLINLIFVGLTLYYFFDYPKHYAIVFRIKASSEMILAVLYMSISMHVSANIENAVKYAANNLKGPLSRDLKQLLWDVYTRKYSSISNGLDDFITKWKVESEEFSQAITMINTASLQSSKRMQQTLDEAVDVVLVGTKERMEKYALELKTPVTSLNALGILLPIVGLVFFPIVAIFLPTPIQPSFLFVGYDILLPVGVYMMMKGYLEKRPYTFHQPDLSKHPKFKKEKFFGPPLIISVVFGLSLISLGLFLVFSIGGVFNQNLYMSSFLITGGLGGGIVLYMILTTHNKLKIRKEIVEIESEFTEVLFLLGNQLSRGASMESSIKIIMPRIKELKISKFFDKILYNIEIFGMTFQEAIFDPKSGAILEYPSQLIEAIMGAITQVSKRGTQIVSESMIFISKYLKGMHTVERDLQETLSEVSSTMEIQAKLLAPISAGIVVALSAIVTQMLLVLKISVDQIQGQLSGFGPLGTAGTGILDSFININNIIPVHVFQFIVGLYMIEVVIMLTVFMSIIKNGDEKLMRNYSVGKTLLLGLLIYTVIAIFIFLMFQGIIPVSGLII